MKYVSISHKVIEILKNKLYIPDNLLTEDNWSKPLTGNPLNLSSVDMVYFILELEKEYNIRIASEHLSDYRFSTVNRVVELLQEYV